MNIYKKIRNTKILSVVFSMLLISTLLTVEIGIPTTIIPQESVFLGLRNPTYSEVIEFISLDKTNERTYIKNIYTCVNFSIDLMENATAYGIRSFPTILMKSNAETSHMIVIFLTIDRGLIYIEPQDDSIITNYLDYIDHLNGI